MSLPVYIFGANPSYRPARAKLTAYVNPKSFAGIDTKEKLRAAVTAESKQMLRITSDEQLRNVDAFVDVEANPEVLLDGTKVWDPPEPEQRIFSQFHYPDFAGFEDANGTILSGKVRSAVNRAVNFNSMSMGAFACSFMYDAGPGVVTNGNWSGSEWLAWNRAQYAAALMDAFYAPSAGRLAIAIGLYLPHDQRAVPQHKLDFIRSVLNCRAARMPKANAPPVGVCMTPRFLARKGIDTGDYGPYMAVQDWTSQLQQVKATGIDFIGVFIPEGNQPVATERPMIEAAEAVAA